MQAVVRSLVLQRVVEVEVRAAGRLVARADLGARPEVAVGDLRVQQEAVADAIGAANANAPIVLAIVRRRQRGLREPVAGPSPLRVVGQLQQRVRPLALLLGERHDR